MFEYRLSNSHLKENKSPLYKINVYLLLFGYVSTNTHVFVTSDPRIGIVTCEIQSTQ